MTKASVMRVVERGIDGIAMIAAFNFLVISGWLEPWTDLTGIVAVFLVAVVLSAIISTVRQMTEQPK